MLRRIVLLLVLLAILSSTASPVTARLSVSPQEALSEKPVPGCQWFWVRDSWVRDVKTTHTGWYATEEGNPDPYRPVTCLKEPGAEFVFPDVSLETFQDPENPPEIVEVVYLPYRSGDIGGHHGIQLLPIGHWEWACG